MFWLRKMDPRQVLGRKEDVASALAALNIPEGSKPAEIARAIEEILANQWMTLELNEDYIDRQGTAQGHSFVPLVKKYYQSLIEEFYFTTEENLKGVEKGHFTDNLEQVGWARFLVYNGFREFLDDGFREGFSKGVDPSLATHSSMHTWAENNGFKEDIRSFIEWVKEGKKYEYLRDGNPSGDVFFLINFMEAIEKVEAMYREDFAKGQWLFPSHESPEKGYKGYSIICPLFHNIGPVAHNMASGHYQIRIVEK